MVYHKSPVSINQAINQGKVKMLAETGQVYKFDKIELRDSNYFGMGREYLNEYNYISPEGAKTHIDSSMFKAIYIKDAQKSKTRTVLLVVGVSIPVAFFVIGTLAFIFSGL